MRKLLLVLLMGTSGCNWWYNEVPSPDDLMHAVPWFDHMITSKAVHPYQSDTVPRNTVPGTVPLGDIEADWGTTGAMAAMTIYSFDVAQADAHVRPAGVAGAGAAVPGVVRAGGELYQTFCSVCHGPAGNGQGLVKVGAPALNTVRVAGYTDGFLYSIVRYGRNLMPPYGDKIVRRDERWAVVDYVRSLQGAPGAVTPVATPATGGTN